MMIHPLAATAHPRMDSLRAAVPALADKLLEPLANRMAKRHERAWQSRNGQAKCVIGIPATNVQAVLGPKGSLASYVNAIVEAGARPLLLLPSRGSASEQMQHIDGLLVPGGYDVDPASYGEVKGPGMARSTILPIFDAFSLDCIRMAYGTSLPLLGICKGMQLMGVAAGAKINQDIPHHKATKGPDAEHALQIVTGSRLEHLLGTQPIITNSAHHQSLRELPPGLRATATAPDQVIEGVERVDTPWQLGVQGHPERARRKEPRFNQLFADLVANSTAFHHGGAAAVAARLAD